MIPASLGIWGPKKSIPPATGKGGAKKTITPGKGAKPGKGGGGKKGIASAAVVPLLVAALLVLAACDEGSDEPTHTQTCVTPASSGTPAPAPSTDEPRWSEVCEVPFR